MLTKELYQLVLALHGLDLGLILSLVFLDSGSPPVFGGPFEDLAIVYRIFGELTAM